MRRRERRGRRFFVSVQASQSLYALSLSALPRHPGNRYRRAHTVIGRSTTRSFFRARIFLEDPNSVMIELNFPSAAESIVVTEDCVNTESKKTVLRMIPYGIYVLTADDAKGNLAASTVNWVTHSLLPSWSWASRLIPVLTKPRKRLAPSRSICSPSNRRTWLSRSFDQRT